MKKCKFCSEEIQDDAVKCKHCGEWLNNEENFQNKNTVENKFDEVTLKAKNKYKKWIFALLILLTIYIPQIIAMNFNTDFAFGYPTGDEYQIAKIIGGVIAAFLIYNFLKLFEINKSVAVTVSIFSMIPVVRLIVAVGIFLYFKRINEQPNIKSNLKNSVKDILTLFFGYLAIHIMLIAFSGLYVSPEKMDVYRLIVAIILLFLISRRKLIFNQKNFIVYIISSILFTFSVIV